MTGTTGREIPAPTCSLRDVNRDAMEEAVMDMTGEDAPEMQRAKKEYVWDKKKRRYIKLQKSEQVTASGKRVIRNEAGALVQVKDSGSGAIGGGARLWGELSGWHCLCCVQRGREMCCSRRNREMCHGKVLQSCEKGQLS